MMDIQKIITLTKNNELRWLSYSTIDSISLKAVYSRDPFEAEIRLVETIRPFSIFGLFRKHFKVEISAPVYSEGHGSLITITDQLGVIDETHELIKVINSQMSERDASSKAKLHSMFN